MSTIADYWILQNAPRRYLNHSANGQCLAQTSHFQNFPPVDQQEKYYHLKQPKFPRPKKIEHLKDQHRTGYRQHLHHIDVDKGAHAFDRENGLIPVLQNENWIVREPPRRQYPISKAHADQY